ncbi:hypothetical protein CMI38_00800 [Candidatus Pacearchaeota archaeon]|jgi:predicted nucleic acid-binding protein|nr:hypothetical protein [Candidatus Pacearchaeota archaeon]|tara:strand:+ start:8165 stop:8581 length:417 start_codon:yes stop_codon:yes gene_type:complete
MKLVLDTNALFSILNPKSISAYLFHHMKTQFLAPEFIKSELNKYKSTCMFKANLSEYEFTTGKEEIEKLIEFFNVLSYEDFLEKSINLISDKNDADFLALAISQNASIWSNDKHLKEQFLVSVYTTEELVDMFINNKI